jgi:hypothetical protein
MLTHQDKFVLCGYKMPQYFWFMISGALCDVIQAILDFIVYNIYVYEWERATVCWTISYTLSIIFRHSSHRFIVFGDFEGSYCVSLGRTYLAYSASIVISMVTNHFIVDIFRISHARAWLATMIWTGIVNYFLLKASWRAKPKEKDISSNKVDQEWSEMKIRSTVV